MRSITILMVTLALAFCVKANTREELLKKFENVSKECKTEEKASEGDMDDLMHHRTITTREGKCMLACIMEEFKTLDDDGKLDKDVLMKLNKDIDSDELKVRKGEQVIDACLDIEVPKDRCEKGFLYTECLREEADSRKVDFVFIWGDDV